MLHPDPDGAFYLGKQKAPPVIRETTRGQHRSRRSVQFVTTTDYSSDTILTSW